MKVMQQHVTRVMDAAGIHEDDSYAKALEKAFMTINKVFPRVPEYSERALQAEAAKKLRPWFDREHPVAPVLATNGRPTARAPEAPEPLRRPLRRPGKWDFSTNARNGVILTSITAEPARSRPEEDAPAPTPPAGDFMAAPKGWKFTTNADGDLQITTSRDGGGQDAWTPADQAAQDEHDIRVFGEPRGDRKTSKPVAAFGMKTPVGYVDAPKSSSPAYPAASDAASVAAGRATPEEVARRVRKTGLDVGTPGLRNPLGNVAHDVVPLMRPKWDWNYQRSDSDV